MREVGLFLILIATIVRASNTDQFIVTDSKTDLQQVSGDDKTVLISAGGDKFCFSYRASASTIVFGFGTVDTFSSRPITVQGMPFTVGTIAGSCFVFYFEYFGSLSGSLYFYIVAESENGNQTKTFASTGPEFSSITTAANSEDNDTIVLGYIGNDGPTSMSFSMLIYNRTKDNFAVSLTEFITVDGLETTIDISDYILLNLPPTMKNFSVVLKTPNHLRFANCQNPKPNTYSFTASQTFNLTTNGFASRVISIDVGIVCYSTNNVTCLEWNPRTANVTGSRFSFNVDQPGKLALATTNDTAGVLFGISNSSVFAFQFDGRQQISLNPLKNQQFDSVRSLAVTNTNDSNYFTMMLFNNVGRVLLARVQRNYCGDGIPNDYECVNGQTCSDCVPEASPMNSPVNEPTNKSPVSAGNITPSEQTNGNEPKPDPAVVAPAVVIPVVVVAAGLIVLLLLLRRRNKKRRDSLLHGKVAMESIDNRLKIPYKSLVFKKEIGAGSYGKVYIGEWKGASVAIKVSTSVTDIDAFFDEARITVGLQQHPNVVQTFGVSLDGQLPCIVLEFCEGGSLDTRLFDSDVTLTEQQKVALIKGVALGLYHLHTNNIVHRDLAARNVLLKSGTPKISDFGMSRVLKSEAEKGKTRTNYGPIRWMAPESLRDLQYSTKSDVWSFGIVMYEIICRNEPHTDIDALEVAVKIKNEAYHPLIPQEAHPVLAEIMLACWHADPNDRPSMEQICNKLQSAFPDA